MIRALLSASTTILLSASLQAQTPAWVEQAREAARELGRQLKSELTSASSETGSAGGVEVCRDRAPAIAADLSPDGVRVGRTALRVRNPDNAPDAWEHAVLSNFAERLGTGADPGSIEHWEVQTASGQRIGRWMKAIPMQPQCVLCHGSELSEPLARTLRALYPEDEATGFEPGELRGAFSVRVALGSEDDSN